MARSANRAPASLYLVIGVLAAFGALMLVRMIIGLVFSLLTVAVVIGVLWLLLSALGRRGSR